jgi:magnesium transporter
MAGIDAKLIHDALDLHERPRIEIDDETTLLVIRAPHQEDGHGHTQNQDRYSTVPLGIILTKDCILTVCKLHDAALTNLLHESRHKPGGHRPERCICNLSRGVAVLFLHYLKSISATMREVERDLSHSLDNEDLMLLLNLQKSVTYFHAALKTNDILLDRVIRKGLTVGTQIRLGFSEEEQDLLDDAQTDTRQGIYMAKIFTEVLGSISNVYSSIISNNVNQIMKILTSLTVILMIPTLITSTYGMNIPLPMQEHGSAFAVVGLLSVGLTTAAIMYMKRKKIL